VTDPTFGDPATALAMRDIVAAIVKDQLTSLRPLPEAMTVTALDSANFVATVVKAEGGDPITVRLGVIQPTHVGQTVLVDGPEGGKYVVDVIGGGTVVGANNPGDVAPTLCDAIGAPWALAAGQTLSGAQTHYPDLWAFTASAFKSGSSIILPDLRGCVVAAADGGVGRLSGGSLNALLGSQTVVLGLQQIPFHTHTQAAHQHGAQIGAAHPNFLVDGNGPGAGLDAAGTANGQIMNKTDLQTPVIAGAGGNPGNSNATDAHTNIQPTRVLNYKVFLGVYVP